MKRNWQLPQLIVLVHAKSQESVLISCKVGDDPTGLAANGATPGSQFGGCYLPLETGGLPHTSAAHLVTCSPRASAEVASSSLTQ